MTQNKVYRIPLATPLLGLEEAESVFQVVKSGWIREGKEVEKFEKTFADYLGVKHAIAVSSGTSALLATLLALEICANNEIIMPSLSCVPPANAAVGLKARPVFVDVEPETLNIDPENARSKVTGRTKAIIPIHYGGCPADLDPLVEICRDNGIVLVEDAAEALGSEYKGKKVGTFGDVAVFSFSPNKTITTGEGGMIVTNDSELAERIRMIKDYGQDRKFHNVTLGYNFKMSEMQAALGIVQMRKVEKIVSLKRRNAAYMTKLLEGIKGIIPPQEPRDVKHAYMLYTIRVTEEYGMCRDDLIDSFEKRGIQTRVYFPPVHLQPLYLKLFGSVNVPVTERIAKQILSLPSSPTLERSDIEEIVAVIIESGKENVPRA